MKIGILTWWDVLNYGSAFQAYALQQSIEQLGAETEILIHDRPMPDYGGNHLLERSMKGLIAWMRNQSPRRRWNRRLTREKLEKFRAFHRQYLRIGDHYSTTRADRVIIGSDQILDIDYFYYPFQFGKGVPSPFIGTYAPCFGETTWESLQKNQAFDEICSSIHTWQSVNARDRNTQDILQKILNRDIPLTLDPVLLYPFEQEKRMWNQRMVDEPYAVVYTWGGFTTGSGFAAQCRDFARRNHLKLVSVGEVRPWCDIQYAAASPVEFFELFLHADMVLTNMFHGTCFSIALDRPFYSFVMPHNQNKLGGLLSFLELESQIKCAPEEIAEAYIPTMDWEKIHHTLEDKRERSFWVLQQMLKGS